MKTLKLIFDNIKAKMKKLLTAADKEAKIDYDKYLEDLDKYDRLK